MSRILSYGCTSSAGPATSDFWQGLKLGLDHSREVSTQSWATSPSFQLYACQWPRSSDTTSARDQIVAQLLRAWQQTLLSLTPQEQENLQKNEIGLIFASTKGYVDDVIWSSDPESLNSDLLTPILFDFIQKTGIQVKRSLCISNACTSSLAALYLADQWIKRKLVSKVLILAADIIGPFVLQGFYSLRALTQDRVAPFSHSRSGLRLGDAAIAVLLSSTENEDEKHGVEPRLELVGVGLFAEGYAATRPSQSGQGLKHACLKIPSLQERSPELVIAHGTGTLLNDATEDRVLTELFPPGSQSPLITATKGSIGHSLGASGGMDLIAACQVLKTQETFLITNSKEIDPEFRSRYLYSGHSYPVPNQFKRILVTSVGFGGVNAAALIQLNGRKR